MEWSLLNSLLSLWESNLRPWSFPLRDAFRLVKAVHWKIWSKNRKDHDLDHIWWSWSRSRSNSENLEMIWSFGKIFKITLRSFFEPCYGNEVSNFVNSEKEKTEKQAPKDKFLDVTSQKLIKLKNFIISLQIYLDFGLNRHWYSFKTQAIFGD